MNGSFSSSRHRSLFRNSNEDRRKREAAVVHDMEEVAAKYLASMEENSCLFDGAGEGDSEDRDTEKVSTVTDSIVVPRFKPSEIILEKTIGMGEFGLVLKVGAIALHPQQISNINHHDENLREEIVNSLWGGSSGMSTKISFSTLDSYDSSTTISMPGDVPKPNLLLVLKQIRKDLYPKKKIAAAKDLAREAKMLARLQKRSFVEDQRRSSSKASRYYNNISHPNIITLKGIASNPGSPDFGILLDRLHPTMDELVISWGKRQESLLRRFRKRGLASSVLLSGLPPVTLPQWIGSPNQGLGSTLAGITKNVEGIFRRGENNDHNKETLNRGVGDASSVEPVLLLLSERVLAMWDIAQGMSFLHSHGILFRDLKTENIGRTIHSNPHQRMQIFDFGLAKECKSVDRIPSESQDETSSRFYDHFMMTGMTGTMRIMAPEVIRCEPYGLPADVYSFAICMWEVFAGTKCSVLSPTPICHTQESIRPELPLVFDDDEDGPSSIDSTIQNKTTRGNICGIGMPKRLENLMQRCWQEDPRQRPNFEEISAILRSVLGDLAKKAAVVGLQKSQPKNEFLFETPISAGSSSSFLSSLKNLNSEKKLFVSPFRSCVNVQSNAGVWNKIQSSIPKKRQQQQQPASLNAANKFSLDRAGVWARVETLRSSGLLDHD